MDLDRLVVVPNPNQPQPIFFVTPGSPPVCAPHTDLPFRLFHGMIGVAQMTAGVLMLVLEVAVLCSAPPVATGEGIYSGVLIFACGLLSALGARFNSRHVIIACLILNITTTVACAIGLGWAAFELYDLSHAYIFLGKVGSYLSFTPAVIGFAYGKSIFMSICCFIEILLTIVHAHLSRKSICLSSDPRAACEEGRTALPTVFGQHGIAYQIDFAACRFAHMHQAAVPREVGDIAQQQQQQQQQQQHQQEQQQQQQESADVDPEGDTVESPRNASSQFRYERLSD